MEHLQKGDPRARYVKEAIDELARRLGARFGRGFSTTNLRYLRSFLLAYATRRPEIRHIGSDESDARRQIRRKAGDVSAALVNAVGPQAGLLAAEPWRMQQFFEAYRGAPDLSTMVRELPWSANLHILSCAKRPGSRATRPGS